MFHGCWLWKGVFRVAQTLNGSVRCYHGPQKSYVISSLYLVPYTFSFDLNLLVEKIIGVRP